LITINDIIWLNRIVEKLAWKHNVLPSEVEEVLGGDCKFFFKKKGKVDGENLYNALGTTDSGRFLSIFFIKKLGNKALIITARALIIAREDDMKKNKDIKEMSVMEASDFWDEHDFGEFDDVKMVRSIEFSLRKKKYVGINEDLYSAIKKKAKKLHKSEDTLINKWLSEKAREQRHPL
jgi:hypothetical protein